MKKIRNTIIVIFLIILLGFLLWNKSRAYFWGKNLDDMEKIDIDNVVIYYTDEENSKESIELIKNFIPEVEKNIDRILPNVNEKNLKIILYNTDSFQAKWVYEKLFMHEYAHFKFFAFLEQKDIKNSSIPIWFIEGFAEYFGYNCEVGYSPSALNKEKDFITLTTISDFEQARKENYNVYLQSYYTIDELIKPNSRENIADIILKTKEVDFYTAFESVTKMDINEFQNIYLEDEKDEYYQITNNKIN